MSLVCPAPDSAREPGFLRALDEQQMQQLVRDHLGGGRIAVELEPDYVRWKERDGSLVGWRAKVGSDGTQSYITARNAPLDRLQTEVGKVQHREEDYDGLTSFALIPEAELLLLTFPLDRQLPDLRRLVRASKMRSMLLETRPDLVPEGARISKSKSAFDIVRYKPERRAVLRWNLGFKDLQTRAVTRRTIWIRVLAEALPSRNLCARAAAATGVAVPEILGNPDACLVIESHLPGRPWLQGDLAPIDAIAATLARVHGASIPNGVRHHDGAAELELASRAIEDLGRLHAEHGQAGAAVLATLSASVPAPGPARLLHGDFHTGQILLDASIGICDFDRSCAGPAAADLAAFYAHAVLADAQAGAAFATAFIDAFGRNAVLPSARELQWWNSCALLRIATQPFRALRADWPTTCTRLLDAAAAAAKGTS